jgi:hypothetical protein
MSHEKLCLWSLQNPDPKIYQCVVQLKPIFSKKFTSHILFSDRQKMFMMESHVVLAKK